MNAAHLRELIALGITGEILVRVAEIIDEESSAASADKSADIRRGPLESTAEQARKERDKQRKRAGRAAEKAAKLSALPSKDMSADSPSLLDEGKKERSLQVQVKKESKKGSRLLIGAIINDENRAVAIECGCPPDRVDSTWTEFVDYWSDIPGQKGCKLSWNGTWRNRIKYILGNGGFSNSPTGKPLTEFQRKQAETNDVRSQLRDVANGGPSGGTSYRILPDDHGERSEGLRGGASSTILALPGAFGRSGN